MNLHVLHLDVRKKASFSFLQQIRADIDKKLLMSLNPFFFKRWVNIAIMIPFPATKVYELAKENLCGLKLLSEDWDIYTKQRGGPLELESVSLCKLRKIQTFAYIKYYSSPKRIMLLLKDITLKRLISILFRALIDIVSLKPAN